MIETLFKHYDASQQGFWTPAEAATFFSHFAHEWPLSDLQSLQNAAQAKATLAAFTEPGHKMTEEEENGFKQMQAEEEKKVQTEIAQKLANYLENKKDRDMEAFKFVDSNSDGKIDLSELVAALTPSSP